MNRLWMSPALTAGAVVLLFLFAATTSAQSGVTWTNLVHVTATAGVLAKDSGCDGCLDAGAASQDEISTGDGYVEFTIGETNTFWMAGLSHRNDDTTFADIDFGFRFNGGGWADVLENGAYQSGGDTPYATGDVFRIALVGGVIKYSRNGTLLLEHARSVTYPLALDTSFGSMGATVHNAQLVVTTAPPISIGGPFIEKAGSPALRARLTTADIAAFLPAGGATGTFSFPPPYNTLGIRLTNDADCGGPLDCLWYTGYSYWRNTNNHVGSALMYVFLSMDMSRGGLGPSLVSYNKFTDEVQNLGPLFDESQPYAWSSGEGWYFSGTLPTKLYVFLVGTGQLWRYDVLGKFADPAPALDLNQCPRNVCPPAAAYINQPHSSDNDLVHSATVQDIDFQRLGCVVHHEGTDLYSYFPKPAGYGFDECHIDKSGRWLILLETTPGWQGTNRIVDLQSGSVTTLDDAQGSLGHLDMGYGYAIGADNYNGLPNATILLKFPLTSTTRPIGPVVHFNKRWDIAAANHIAHGNARPGMPAEQQYACGSNASRTPDMADEIVCFTLDPSRYPDGSLDVMVVAPTMTNLDATGGGGDYEKTPKGNLDVTGQYFIWTTNLGGDRLDAFIVKLPVQLADATTNAAPTSPSAGTDVSDSTGTPASRRSVRAAAPKKPRKKS